MSEPHPYLTIWLGCKRYSSDTHRVLPDSGGWLDQQAELLMAFEVLEELHAEESKSQEVRDKQLAEFTQRRKELLAR